MKTLTTIAITSVLAFSMISVPAQAQSLTDMLAETASKQLADISLNIKQQAKSAIENTVTELLSLPQQTAKPEAQAAETKNENKSNEQLTVVH